MQPCARRCLFELYCKLWLSCGLLVGIVKLSRAQILSMHDSKYIIVVNAHLLR